MLEAIAQSATSPNDAPKVGGAYQAVDTDGGGAGGGPGGGGVGGPFLLLADGTSKLLLANGVDRLLLTGASAAPVSTFFIYGF